MNKMDEVSWVKWNGGIDFLNFISGFWFCQHQSRGSEVDSKTTKPTKNYEPSEMS